MNKKLRKGFKIFALSFGLILLLLALFANTIVSHILKSGLEEALKKSNKNALSYTVEDINIDVWSGDMTISNIEISHKDTILDSLKALNTNTPLLKNLSIKTISLENMAMQKLLFSRAIKLDKIVISGIDINMYFGDSITASSPPQYDTILQNELSLFEVDSFIIDKASLHVYRLEDDTLLANVNALSLKTGTIKVDVKNKSNNFISAANSIHITMDGGTFHDIEDYQLSFRDFKFDLSSTHFSVDSLKLSPTPETHKGGGNNSFASLIIPHFEIKGINKLKLIQQQILEIQEVNIHAPHLTYNLDAAYTNPVDKHAMYPVEALLKSVIKFHIRKINLVKGFIKLNYMYDLYKAPVPIYFDSIDVIATNSGTHIKNKEYITFDYKTNFMKTTPFEGKVSLSLKSARDFYAEGNFHSPIDLTQFNKITSYDNKMKFAPESQFDKGSFKFRGQNGYTEGYMHLDYQKVAIIKLKENEHGRLEHKSKFFNLLANGLVKNKNIPGDVAYKTGYINYKLPEHRGFFGVLWESIACGIKDILLMNSTKHDDVIIDIKRKLQQGSF